MLHLELLISAQNSSFIIYAKYANRLCTENKVLPYSYLRVSGNIHIRQNPRHIS